MNTPSTLWTPLCVGIREHLAAMSPSELAVYIALVSRRNGTTGQLNPTLLTLSKDTGYHVDVVCAAISKLVTRGLVERCGGVFNRSYKLPDIAFDGSASRGNIGKTKDRIDESSDRRMIGLLSDDSSESLSDDSSEQSKYKGSKYKGSKYHIAAAPLGGFAAVPTGEALSSFSNGTEPEGEHDRGHSPEALEPSSLVKSSSSEGSTVAAEGPAASSKRRRVSKAGKGSAKPALGLTDDQMNSVCASPAATAAYWTHGFDAVGKPTAEWTSLPASRTHWAPGSRDLTKPAADVGVDALAAWTWVQFTKARAGAAIAITMPAFSRLLGSVKNVRSRMPLSEFVTVVSSICANWPEIAASLSWMSSLPVLNEDTLNCAKIVDAARRLAAGESLKQEASQLPAGWTRNNEPLDIWKGSNYAATAN